MAGIRYLRVDLAGGIKDVSSVYPSPYSPVSSTDVCRQSCPFRIFLPLLKSPLSGHGVTYLSPTFFRAAAPSTGDTATKKVWKSVIGSVICGMSNRGIIVPPLG